MDSVVWNYNLTFINSHLRHIESIILYHKTLFVSFIVLAKLILGGGHQGGGVCVRVWRLSIYQIIHFLREGALYYSFSTGYQAPSPFIQSSLWNHFCVVDTNTGTKNTASIRYNSSSQSAHIIVEGINH